MSKREITCPHDLPVSQCPEHWEQLSGETSVVKTMWAIHPGEVRARDGDVHFISYEQLIRLYGVHPTMCVKARDGWDRTYSPEFRQQFVHLYPREDGKYQVNGLVNLNPDATTGLLKSAQSPKQSKDVDSSLREQIRKLLVFHLDCDSDAHIENEVNDWEKLVTTYIEAAEIDRAIAELKIFAGDVSLPPDCPKNCKEEHWHHVAHTNVKYQIKELQAQKAVLEGQDD